MTSRIKATITHNYPVEVVKVAEGYPSVTVHRCADADEKAGTYVGERTTEIDEWFTGSAVILVCEVQPKKV
jgi:hypothetical protein